MNLFADVHDHLFITFSLISLPYTNCGVALPTLYIIQDDDIWMKGRVK